LFYRPWQLLYIQLGDYIHGPEPEATIVEEFLIRIPNWPKMDLQKLLAIVGGVLAILGLGWLVKILSSIMIDNSKKIKFLDYMDGSL
jgi:hypothetical protein